MSEYNEYDPVIGEYADNPFISKLPRLQKTVERVKQLRQAPAFDEAEAAYPPHVRKHCVLRLTRFFEPVERQLMLADRFDLLLRQGYIGRNPLTHQYLLHLQNGIDRIEARSLDVSGLRPVENTAQSFVLAGCSGIGKSRSIERVMHQYPEVIHHDEPFTLKQVVWLKLDCPSQGSPKQLCISFFAAIDKLLGTSYLTWYGGAKKSLDEMMVHMAHVANLHALGVLVIDEIQHLSKCKIGPNALLSFLVTLVNTIGVPVILIGTLSAVPLFQDNFRHARRGSGLGSLVWDRLPKGKAWDHFVDTLWQYQWTNHRAELSDEIREALYDHSQGIVDVLVKLFVLAQLRLIAISEVRPRKEEITVGLLNKVAKEDFSIIAPMISALRKNDTRALLKYDDLLPLHEHFNQLIANSTVTANVATLETKHFTSSEVLPEGQDSIVAAIKLLGVAPDIADQLINEVRVGTGSDDPIAIISRLGQILASSTAKLKGKPKAKTKKSTVVPSEPDDLRVILKSANEDKTAAHSALVSADLIMDLSTDFTCI